jgi:hypothetical protein
MNDEDLAILQAVLAEYIGEKLDDWSVSGGLFEDCRNKADWELLDEKDASTLIQEELWIKSNHTHRIRLVKD